MKDMLKSVFMVSKGLGTETKEEEIDIDFDCPSCGDKMIGVDNNITHSFEIPKKRCMCKCGYKGFYPVIKEENNDGLE